MAKVLIVTAAGLADATRVSVPFHIAVNGIAASGKPSGIALAGDATDLVKQGASRPALRGVRRRDRQASHLPVVLAPDVHEQVMG